MCGVTDYRFVLLHGVGGSTFAFLVKLFLQKVAGVRQVPACLSHRICLRSNYVLADIVLRVGRLALAVGDFWP
jgi:hypothetical protein